METRNLRKVRTGVVFSNKMDKTITVAVKSAIPSMVNSLTKRRNTMRMTKKMNAISVIPYASWKLVR